MSINRLFVSEKAAKLFGVTLDEDALDSLEAYYDAVIDANKEFNLTAITSKDEFAEKHILDSLAALPFIKENAVVADVGSGAGFPALPIAAARKDVKVTAIDSTAKKMNFVQSASRAAGVKNLNVFIGRAEESKYLYGTFDVVTARAVSSLPVLIELCIPLVKTGGVLIAYKTDETELQQSENALKVLNCAVCEVKTFSLPSGDRRAVIVIKKLAPTPKPYPRQFGQIKKKPL